MILLDSCILIDIINRNHKLEKSYKENYCINSIVQMEVIAGVKNKEDLNNTNTLLLSFNNVDTTQEILDLATLYMLKYKLSHNMTIYDAIIAATCVIYDLELYTHNRKDFKFIEELVIKY